MYVALVDPRVAEDLLNGFERAAEEILGELLEARTGDGGLEVDTLVERVDFDGGLGCGRQNALGTFASGMETAERTGV